MTKAEYIEEIQNFFKTDDYKLNWNGYSTKKEAQKNGVEEPACTVEFLKDGAVVRTATCGTEIECLREVYKEVYDAWYQEWSKEYEKESAIAAEAARKEMEERFEKERISEMESNILKSIQDRICCMVYLRGGKARQCCIGGVGFLQNGEKAIVIYQYFGTPEEDNRKWHIFRENDIEHFRLMTEADVINEAPEGFETTDMWNEFKTVLYKTNFPKEEKKGFFSRLFGR